MSGGVNVKSSWNDEEEADSEEECVPDGATKAAVDGRSEAPITAAVLREDFIVWYQIAKLRRSMPTSAFD